MVAESMLGLLVHVAGFEQRFTRDTADTQTSAAKTSIFINTGDVDTELRGPDSGHITGGTAAQNNEFVASRGSHAKGFGWRKAKKRIRLIVPNSCHVVDSTESNGSSTPGY